MEHWNTKHIGTANVIQFRFPMVLYIRPRRSTMTQKDWAMKTENTIITGILLCMLTIQDKHNLCCERVARALGNLAQSRDWVRADNRIVKVLTKGSIVVLIQ